MRIRWRSGLAVTALPWTAVAGETVPAASPLGPAAVAQVLGALAVVLALLGGAAWLLRRLGAGGMRRGGAVRILGGAALGARERLVLVEVGETQLLLGVAPGRVQTLHVLERPVRETEGRAAPADSGFARRLAAALQRDRSGEGRA